MGMESAEYLTGQFLLAMPGIGDPRFERSVIAMCAHDENGALGVGIGATIAGLGLHDLLEQFEIEPGEAPDAPIHFGGPVEPRRGFVLHSLDWGGQDTIDISGDLDHPHPSAPSALPPSPDGREKGPASRR